MNNEILATLLCNVGPKGQIPKSHLDGPLIIDAAMIERMTKDKDFYHRLQGWKWDVLWTTDAVVKMMGIEASDTEEVIHFEKELWISDAPKIPLSKHDP